MAENEEREFYTLTDEEGNETEFELIATTELGGKTYYAMIPANTDDQTETEDGFCEYVILREDKDKNGEISLVTLDDDEEFDNVADVFDDLFSEEIDYDGDQQ